MILYLVAIFILALVLIITIGVALIYFGIFENVVVSTGASPFAFAGSEIACKLGKGKPADSGALFTEVCSIVPRRTTIGIYLELEKPNPDNPSAERETRKQAFSTHFNPASDDCHYLVGVITGHAQTDYSSSDNQQTITASERSLLIEKGFQFTRLPASDNVVYSKFPFRGIISVVVGIRRVYPMLMRYISEHRLCAYPAMEIYDQDTIHYILPLSQQSHFLSLFTPAITTHNDSSDLETEIEEVVEDESTSAQSSTSSFEEL